MAYEKKEKRGSPKSDWLRQMREQRYEESQQRGREKKARPKVDGTEAQFDENTKHWPEAALAVAAMDSEPELIPESGPEPAPESGEDEYRDLAAEARKAKKGRKS